MKNEMFFKLNLTTINMGFFDDDPFEEIMKEFFGDTKRRRKTNGFIEGEREERVIDIVDSDKKVYLIFELPGFEKKDILITVKGRIIEINATKHSMEKVKSYLTKKLGSGVTISKNLPQSVNPKKFTYTINNGILEIVFDRNK